jgi:hypothetical protein
MVHSPRSTEETRFIGLGYRQKNSGFSNELAPDFPSGVTAGLLMPSLWFFSVDRGLWTVNYKLIYAANFRFTSLRLMLRWEAL